MLPWFQRACLLVQDIPASLALYRDILGLEVSHLGEDGPDAYSYEIFRIPTDVATRFATLDSPEQPRTLALIEVPSEVLSRPSVAPAAIVIRVASVSDTLVLAANAGFSTTEPRWHKAPERGPARAEAAIYDPDGHPAVIYELLESPE